MPVIQKILLGAMIVSFSCALQYLPSSLTFINVFIFYSSSLDKDRAELIIPILQIRKPTPQKPEGFDLAYLAVKGKARTGILCQVLLCQALTLICSSTQFHALGVLWSTCECLHRPQQRLSVLCFSVL